MTHNELSMSPKKSFQQFCGSAFRWIWLSALLFAALGYLTSGMSSARSRLTAERIDAESGTPNDAAPAPLDLDTSNSPDVSVDAGSFRADQQGSSLGTGTFGVTPSDASNGSTPDLPPELVDAVRNLNEARAARLAKWDLPSAPMADWMTVCRRISMSLVGTGMSLQEIRQLQSVAPEQRVPRHLNRLLSDARYHDYWGERWTRFYVGAEEGPFLVFRRRKFRTWLTEQFASNRRYDNIARDLITAKGLWTDQPQVNFYTVTYDSGDDGPDPIRLAARTSRVFLGLRIDCLQCHDDFLGNVTLGDGPHWRTGCQQDFHQLAAFFTAAEANGLQGLRSVPVNYQTKYLGSETEEDVPAKVPFAEELLPEKGPARVRLATWITSPKNRQAARATVSHVWALLMGKPRDETVDNLPLDSAMDATMNLLVDDFIDNGFDIRRLIRLIVLSDAFRVDSRAPFHVTLRHDMAGATFPLVRLRPEQIGGAVIQSSRVKTVDRDSSFFVQFQRLTEGNDFVRRYGDTGEDQFSDDAITISQRLVMLNGKLVAESTKHNPVLNSTAHVEMFSGDDATVVENAYLCVLNRLPTAGERAQFMMRLEESGNRKHAVQDIFWTLLNSSEFAWNH
ncbi:MAG: DUF1549 domain-containing protein [Planctomycetota bacterium]